MAIKLVCQGVTFGEIEATSGSVSFLIDEHDGSTKGGKWVEFSHIEEEDRQILFDNMPTRMEFKGSGKVSIIRCR